MYRFSRSMYRELAPRVVEDDWDPTRVPEQAEGAGGLRGAIRRLTYDRRYFARPARSLFNDVRPYFAMGDQLFVWTRDRANISLALEFLSRLPEGVGLDGRPPQCNAHTRKGTPCQRPPLPGRDYCPSHKHLEETFEGAETAAPSRRSTASRSLQRLARPPRPRDSEQRTRPRPTAGALACPGAIRRAVGCAHAARGRRRRDVHRRGAVRRARRCTRRRRPPRRTTSRGACSPRSRRPWSGRAPVPARSRPSPTG